MGNFEQAARNVSQKGAVGEFWHFLRQNKKWWLLPIVVVMLLFGVLVFLSSTGAAPFIYTLFYSVDVACLSLSESPERAGMAPWRSAEMVARSLARIRGRRRRNWPSSPSEVG